MNEAHPITTMHTGQVLLYTGTITNGAWITPEEAAEQKWETGYGITRLEDTQYQLSLYDAPENDTPVTVNDAYMGLEFYPTLTAALGGVTDHHNHLQALRAEVKALYPHLREQEQLLPRISPELSYTFKNNAGQCVRFYYHATSRTEGGWTLNVDEDIIEYGDSNPSIKDLIPSLSEYGLNSATNN